MKTIVALSLGVILIGCNGANSANPPTADAGNPAASTPATTPASTTPAPPSPNNAPVASSTTSGLTAPVPPSSTSTNTDARTGESPNRINQLKDLKVVTIKANGHPVKVWLMDTESKREEGMMFLKDQDVREDEGMLFLFPELQVNDGRHSFWMHNCPLGLDICYIGPNKRVLNVANGKPYDETPVAPTGDYRYVLEMKVNCARKLGVKPGTQVAIPDSLKGTP